MAVFYRVFPAGAAIAAFALLGVLYLSGQHELYTRILAGWGVEPFRFPFLDTSGALAAWDCTRLGVDVIVHDPCDVLDRSYNYSPLWMSLAAVPLGRADAGPVGFALGVLFLCALPLPPPPRRPFELVLVTLATTSGSVAFAVERANPDLLIFLLALAIGFLSARSPPARIGAYCLALLAAAIKYYPLTLLILLARERAIVFGLMLVTAVAAIAAFVVGYTPEIARGIPMIPSGPYYSGFFGAKNLPLLLSDFVAHAGAPSPARMLARAASIAALLGALLLLIAAICRRLLRCTAVSAARRRLTVPEGNLLVIGSALVVGCFFAGQNIVYRGIFLLFVLPGLLGLARGTTDAGPRRLLTGAAVAVVLLLWEEFFRLSLYELPARLGLPSGAAFGIDALFWLCRELAWWLAIAVMSWVLLDFGRNSAIARAVPIIGGRLRPKLRRA